MSLNPDDLFEIQSNTVAEANGMKIKRKKSNTNLEKGFFPNGILDHWNKLPLNVVNVKTIGTFKNQLDN